MYYNILIHLLCLLNCKFIEQEYCIVCVFDEMKYRLWNKTVKYFQQYSLPCKTCRDLSLHKVRDSIKWYVCVNVFFFKSRPPNDSRRVSTDRSILYISKATDEEKLLTTAACDSMTPQLRVFINFYHRKKNDRFEISSVLSLRFCCISFDSKAILIGSHRMSTLPNVCITL